MDIQKLTKQQAIIITGFTGVLCGEMSDFHADVEKRLGRGVQTFEFGNEIFMAELKGIYRDDFTKIATVEPEIQTQKLSDLEKEREAFEAEFAKTNFYKGMVESLKNEDCPLTSVFEMRNGEYRSPYVKLSFDMWQAAKAQVPEGFVLVSKELPESIAEAMALERVSKHFGETDPVWIEITDKVYKEHLVSKKWELCRDYKAMIEAQEQSHD